MLLACMPSLPAKWNSNCIPWTYKSVLFILKAVSDFHLIIIIQKLNNNLRIKLNSLPAVVSYSNQKVRLKWDTSGVALNPELKLLQYNLGQPLELDESNGYMPEKHGTFESGTFLCDKIHYWCCFIYQLVRQLFSSHRIFSFRASNWSSSDSNICAVNTGGDAVLVQFLARSGRDSRSSHVTRHLHADTGHNVYRPESWYSARCICKGICVCLCVLVCIRLVGRWFDYQ